MATRAVRAWQERRTVSAPATLPAPERRTRPRAAVRTPVDAGLADGAAPAAVAPAVPSRAPRSRRVAAVVAPPAASEAPTPEALYQAAHQAHFVHRDYADALAGWDRYLRAAPGGPLALEARYNRGIAPLRLGRRAEAAAALQPFAAGEYGAYRQAEAASVLSGASP